QSARSYLQAEHLDAPKVKVKTRSDVPTLFDKGKGILSKFSLGSKENALPKESKSTRRSWFSHLGRKAKTSLHQLLNTAEDTTRGATGMKWETFVKVVYISFPSYLTQTIAAYERHGLPSRREHCRKQRAI